MEYALVVAFDRDTVDFARGVEVGILHQRLRTEPLPLEATVHVENAEMAIRLADTNGLTVRAENPNGEWLQLVFSSSVSPGSMSS
jgi:hypothetical protein